MKLFLIVLILLAFVSACSDNQVSREPIFSKESMPKADELYRKLKRPNFDEVAELLELVEDAEFTIEVSPPGAKFKIQFPEFDKDVESGMSTQIIDGEAYEIFHLFSNMEGVESENLLYQLDYIFLGDDLETEEQVNDLFNAQRDYLLAATNSVLLFDKIIEKDGVPGRYLYLDMDESNFKIRHKMYYKEGIFYKMAVVSENGNLFNKLISAFFDSFEFTD